jgi:hypothetical protein
MSGPRVPKAEISGVSGYLMKSFSRRMLGEVPDSLGVFWHNREVLRTMFGVQRKADRWSTATRA